MKIKKFLFEWRWMWFCTYFILVGCAHQTVDPISQVSDEVKHQRWQSHVARINSLNVWKMSGRLSVKVPGRSGTMSFEWNQQNDDYTLFLDGAFGSEVASITGNSQGVSVTVAQETRYGQSPEMLLFYMTGWQFPVNNLKYWVRGMVMPDTKATVQLNDLGYPEIIEQEDWTVVYKKYQVFNASHLPTKMTLTHKDVRLNIVVNNIEYGAL